MPSIVQGQPSLLVQQLQPPPSPVLLDPSAGHPQRVEQVRIVLQPVNQGAQQPQVQTQSQPVVPSQQQQPQPQPPKAMPVPVPAAPPTTTTPSPQKMMAGGAANQSSQGSNPQKTREIHGGAGHQMKPSHQPAKPTQPMPIQMTTARPVQMMAAPPNAAPPTQRPSPPQAPAPSPAAPPTAMPPGRPMVSRFNYNLSGLDLMRLVADCHGSGYASDASDDGRFFCCCPASSYDGNKCFLQIGVWVWLSYLRFSHSRLSSLNSPSKRSPHRLSHHVR